MSFRSSLAVTAAVLGAVASARDVPSNVKSFYDGIRAQKQCRNVLAGGFHSVQGDSGSTSQPSPPPLTPLHWLCSLITTNAPS